MLGNVLSGPAVMCKLTRLTWLLWVLMCRCPSATRAIQGLMLQSPTGHSSYKVRNKQGKQMQGMST